MLRGSGVSSGPGPPEMGGDLQAVQILDGHLSYQAGQATTTSVNSYQELRPPLGMRRLLAAAGRLELRAAGGGSKASTVQRPPQHLQSAISCFVGGRSIDILDRDRGRLSQRVGGPSATQQAAPLVDLSEQVPCDRRCRRRSLTSPAGSDRRVRCAHRVIARWAQVEAACRIMARMTRYRPPDRQQ